MQSNPFALPTETTKTAPAISDAAAKDPILLVTTANEPIQFVWGRSPEPKPRVGYYKFMGVLFGPVIAEQLFGLYVSRP